MRALISVTFLLAAGACSGDATRPPDAGPDAPGIQDGAPAEAAVDAPGAEGGGADAPSDGGAGDGEAGADAGAAELVVLNINLLHGFPSFKDLAARTELVAKLIKAEQPDVVTLQEVGQGALLENRAKVLAQKTGYSWYWKQASGVAPVFEEGPGILSRWPIKWKGGVQLPHVNGFEVRVVAGARVATPAGEVYLFSAHLTTQDDATIKADQALAAYQFVAKHPSPLPGVFAGDMNAEPGSLAMKLLRGDATHKGTKGDLVDAWSAVNPTDVGYTSPSDSPKKRIDYVYLVKGTKQPGSVKSCKIVLDQPVNGVYASDHLGLLCRLGLGSAP